MNVVRKSTLSVLFVSLSAAVSACGIQSLTDSASSQFSPGTVIAPQRCRPFSFSFETAIPIDGVLVGASADFTKSCTANNTPYWSFTWSPRESGTAYELMVRSLDYPSLKSKMDLGIANRLKSGLSEADVAFYSDKVIPLLKKTPGNKAAARQIWATYLAGL